MFNKTLRNALIRQGADPDRIRNIIFDAGGVVINTDLQRAVNAFQALGLPRFETYYNLSVQNDAFTRWERGTLSVDGFRTYIRSVLHDDTVTDRQIDEAWCAMIEDMPMERYRLLRRLKARYRLFLFSNTNPLHAAECIRKTKAQYGFSPWEEVFDHLFFSHDIGMTKPDPEAYRCVVRLAGIEAGETLFIDDLEKNVQGARAAGLYAYTLAPGNQIGDLFI